MRLRWWQNTLSTHSAMHSAIFSPAQGVDAGATGQNNGWGAGWAPASLTGLVCPCCSEPSGFPNPRTWWWRRLEFRSFSRFQGGSTNVSLLEIVACPALPLVMAGASWAACGTACCQPKADCCQPACQQQYVTRTVCVPEWVTELRPSGFLSAPRKSAQETAPSTSVFPKRRRSRQSAR